MSMSIHVSRLGSTFQIEPKISRVDLKDICGSLHVTKVGIHSSRVNLPQVSLQDSKVSLQDPDLFNLLLQSEHV
jgi:hypothetical protein